MSYMYFAQGLMSLKYTWGKGGAVHSRTSLSTIQMSISTILISLTDRTNTKCCGQYLDLTDGMKGKQKSHRRQFIILYSTRKM